MITELVENTNIQVSDLNNSIICSKNDQDLIDMIKKRKDNMVKLYIDTRLKIFGSGKKIAVISNIDMIPATSMLLFYSYGDDLTSAIFPG